MWNRVEFPNTKTITYAEAGVYIERRDVNDWWHSNIERAENNNITALSFKLFIVDDSTYTMITLSARLLPTNDDIFPSA